MGFKSVVRSKINKITNIRGMKEGVSVGVAGALVFLVLGLFGTPIQQKDTVADPTALTDNDIAVILMAKENAADSFKESGSGGVQIIVGIYEDGTLFTKSGSYVMNAGTGSAIVKLNGIIHVDTTDGANVGGGEDTLITYTLPAGTLSADGKGIKIKVWGTSAANGNTKTIKIHFGGSSYSNGGVAWNNITWYYETTVIRTGASTQDMVTSTKAGTTDTDVSHIEPTESTGGDIVIKITGESGASASNDVIAEGMIIEFLN